MITIVDYGMGNLGSVLNMCKRIDAPARISSDLEEIGSAEKIILPGVGAFDNAMRRLNEFGMDAVIMKRALEDKIPTLGICLGMQLLVDGSEEGQLPGLGLIRGKAQRFAKKPGLRVPHMGWNVVTPYVESALLQKLPDESRFYFVHSYYVTVADASNRLLTAKHDVEFDAGIVDRNVYGVQFHPEKSHRFGMKLLSNFAHVI